LSVTPQEAKLTPNRGSDRHAAQGRGSYNRLMRQTGVLIAVAAAFAVFLIVQDRFTMLGSRRYAAMQRDALAGRGTAVTVDDVMRPAVRRSVQQGLLWGGVVLAVGLTVALRRR
jgi:hypothetical protein